MSIKDFFIKILLWFIPNKELRADIMFRYKYKMSDISKMTELEYYNYVHENYNIGDYSYISFTTVIKNKEHTKIGKFCSIGLGTYIGTSQHPTNALTTHPIAYNATLNNKYGGKIVASENTRISNVEENLLKPVVIGNDVFIGNNAIIKDGITVGSGAVIGSGAVVTHDVPPYAIVAGVPARIIRYRFDEATIKKLLELKWWDMPIELIQNELPFDNIEKCIERMEQYRNNFV